MQQLDVYFQQFLNMFRASLCPSSGEQDVCYCTWCAALVLLDVVVGRCVVGCEHCEGYCSNSKPVAFPSRMQCLQHVRVVDDPSPSTNAVVR